MANPNPPPPPVDARWKSGQSGNPGGRTPAKWLRELLDAAHDKSEPGKSKRQKIGEHLIEVATSWEVRVVGKDSDGEVLKVASGRDAVEAAKLLMAYDMGKPPNPVELTGREGGPIESVVSTQTTAELRQMVAGMLGLPPDDLPEQVLDGGPAATPKPTE